MPFDRFIPRSLTPSSVRANAPAVSGIYGISNAREWIYIGQSDDIQAALLEHLREAGTSLMERRPTGFVFELCDPAGRPARQGRLILEYKPSCNRVRQSEGA